MTDKEKAVVMAYTGTVMLTGDKFRIFHKYVEDIMGRPVFTHEMGDSKIARKIKEKALPDFLKICNDEFEEDEIKMSDLCVKCKNYNNGEMTYNCKAFITPEFACYEEPTLKEATEHMQSEFDVTGKDVRIFMDHRIKPEV